MRKLIGIVGLLVLMGAVTEGLAQTENLSVGRGFGVGARYLPGALAPIAPGDIDLALGSALVLHYWVSDVLALEVGGWISSFTDQWNPRNYTNLSGGLLLKLTDNTQDDLYLVGRAINVQSSYSNYCIWPMKEPSEPSSPPPDEKIMPPCWRNESRTSTLAVEVLAGLEHSWSTALTTNFEFGFIYAQTMTAHTPPPPPFPEEPMPKPETFASSGFGISIRLSVNFYLWKATK